MEEEMKEQAPKIKSRTAITIDPDLWDRAKEECARRTEAQGKKFSFSALVSEALEAQLPKPARILLATDDDPGL